MKKLLLLCACCLFARVISAQCYTVTSITYAPDSFNVGTPLVVFDDKFSGIINMPFSFCYYGNTYSSLEIGSNGVVTFNSSYANSLCPWSIGAGVPSSINPLNSIFFPWQDLYTDSIARIFYNVYGTAPNRRFVVSFYRCPIYSCLNKLFTGEVMLYETSNIIEMHTQRKEICSTWNGGYSIMGMQNATGTSADVVPARNFPTQWSAYAEGWRFSPNCCNVGMASSTLNSSLEIFPNPASNEIHLNYINDKPVKFSVELEDVSGRIIYQDEFSTVTQRTFYPNAAPGIYFIRLVNENGEILETKKLAIE